MTTPTLHIYRTLPVIKNLPLHIESIASYENYLLIGTRQGLLLFYKCTLKEGVDEKLKIEIIKPNMIYKKPIQQMVVVPELAVFLCLCDGLVAVHRLEPNSCDLIHTHQGVRGVISFTTDVQHKSTISGNQQASLRVAMVTKKRLHLFHWQNNVFHPLGETEFIDLSDTPKRIIWLGSSIFLGFKNEYSIIRNLKGQPETVFQVGSKQVEPILTLIDPADRVGLNVDENMYVLDASGGPLLDHSVRWSSIPAAVISDHPYAVAIIPSSSTIEIRSVNPHHFLQRIDIGTVTSEKLSLLSGSHGNGGTIYVASSKDVICLKTFPVKEQIEALMRDDHYEIALELTKSTDGVKTEKENKPLIDENSINSRKAFYLFCKDKFKEAFDLFFQLEVNPLFVIGLVPGLLPEAVRNKMEYPSRPPSLEGHQLDSAHTALNYYLVRWRNKLYSRKMSKSTQTLQLKALIDTTLLKSYLQTNDALVSSLLRVDNQCEIEETERVLKERHKHEELIDLYKGKGLHRKALEILQEFSKKSTSSLGGYERTIRYLQDLTLDELDLIFEFATWIMKEHPQDGLRIFTEDLPEAEQLPRGCVLQYLDQVKPDLVISYLEHVIHVWQETRPLFHNTLANKYRELAAKLRSEYLLKLAFMPEADSVPAPAGLEPGDLGEIRRKLLTFLETSDSYSQETLVSYLLKDQLHDEWATVMGKMGRHDRALACYVYHLGDLRKAETYCEKMYDKDSIANSGVFLVLLKLYLADGPPKNPFEGDPEFQETAQYAIGTNSQSGPLSSDDSRLKTALEFLTKHPTKLNPKAVIQVIPSSVELKALSQYLIGAYTHLVNQRHSGLIFQSVYLSQSLQAQEERISLEKGQKVFVTEEDVCSVCKKRLGQCDFIRYPNGDLAHYKCRGRDQDGG